MICVHKGVVIVVKKTAPTKNRRQLRCYELSLILRCVIFPKENWKTFENSSTESEDKTDTDDEEMPSKDTSDNVSKVDNSLILHQLFYCVGTSHRKSLSFKSTQGSLI